MTMDIIRLSALLRTRRMQGTQRKPIAENAEKQRTLSAIGFSAFSAFSAQA